MNDERDAALIHELGALRERLTKLEAQNVRRRRFGMVVAAAAVVLTAGFALASAPCANGIPFCFVEGDPALATEVNANFAALKTWLEAKVGATGTLAMPNTDVTTNRVVARNYAPIYSDWGSTTLGAGGASIVNDGSAYRALMVVGNTSAGGARVVKLFDDVVIGSSLQVNGPVVSEGYQISCGHGTNGYHFAFCCRMNIRNGATECKHGTTVGFPNWNNTTTPFTADASGHYSLSCIGHISNANWPLCCRTAADGSTACRVSINPGALTWSNAASPW